ncbi:MAG: hypothetical protein N2491_11250 [Negativicutes bacterium]|nr:hypothetical protein [Negativicutes bacterium]
MNASKDETDKFMQEQFMPFCRRVFDAFKQNQHAIFTLISSFLSGKTNLYGIRITEQGQTAGEYTLHLAGASISHLEAGRLASEIHSPFGIVKPYAIIEKKVLEAMLKDEQNFITNPFAAKMKYMPEVTIKFLRD